MHAAPEELPSQEEMRVSVSSDTEVSFAHETRIECVSHSVDPRRRSVITHARHRTPWLEAMLARRPKNVVVVTLANKMARTAWALLAYGRDYQAGGVAQVTPSDH